MEIFGGSIIQPHFFFFILFETLGKRLYPSIHIICPSIICLSIHPSIHIIYHVYPSIRPYTSSIIYLLTYLLTYFTHHDS